MSITTGLPDSIIQAFSWMLIHSVWQGLLLTLVAGIILMSTKKASAALRHNLVLMLFSVFLVTVVSTFVYEFSNARREAGQDQLRSKLQSNEIFSKGNIYARPAIFINGPHYAEQSPIYSANRIKAAINVAANYFSEHSLFIFMIWFVFFIVKSTSMAGNMLYMHRARRYRVNEPAKYWQNRVVLFCEKLQLKKSVSLLESAYIKVPVVIGYFKPVILIPMGLIAGIPVAQVEAILLHELAHIKRNDYIVNFVQNVAETIFFFNPGLLWVSSRLKEERENCCDDMAIAQSNNKEAYVQALISFKEYSVSIPDYSVAFSGQKSSLLNRVMRIVYQENKTLSIKESSLFLIGIAMLSLMAFTIYPLKPHAPSIAKGIGHVSKKTYPNAQMTKVADDKEVVNKPAAMSHGENDTVKRHRLIGQGLGPNPLVLINGKKYPADVLYRIDPKCMNSSGTYGPNEAVKKFGNRAKDGCVEIRVKGAIVYLTKFELESRNKEISVPKNNFLTRLVLQDKNGKLYDKIVINDKSGSATLTLEVSHNGKVGFYIDKDFYEEEDIKKFSSEMIASLSGAGGCRPPDLRIDKAGYESIFDFSTTKYYQAMKKDSTEFNAAEIKVGKNAAVSALLESMPGIKIDANGTVFYKGVMVTRLFLNNTPYAGEGIQQGIQNLPADIVEKIQVKASTYDNGRAKMINLITKGKDNLPAPSKKGPQYISWADY